jgi:hypothetical protein
MIIMNPAKYVHPTAQPLLLVSKDLPLLEPNRSRFGSPSRRTMEIPESR